MKKDRFNLKLREYVRTHISPTQADRNLISMIYESFKKPLDQACLQIGSYPRFTAIHPIQDLDILYILGSWDEQSCDPTEALQNLYSKINDEYENPTGYKIEIALQTHSITISFKNNNKEIFSVDIVPAYIFSKNEFNYDIYKVPEVLRQKHGKQRTEYYQRLLSEQLAIGWIVSDPNGYIEIAKRLNKSNQDFRKTVKFIKAWKNLCKTKDDDFKLKSFHIEQVLTNYFQENIDKEIFDGIFNFFVNISQTIKIPQIKDRANNGKYIDDYVNELTIWQKEKITKARDYFLINLEELTEDGLIENLLKPCYYKRASNSERFLFDFNIPTFLDDDYTFQIIGEVQERKGGFRKFILDRIGRIPIDRKIKFKIRRSPPDVELFKWKVKNDNSSKEPRGEITDHQTKNDPEHSKYNGNHNIECYAILNNTCVARAKQNVTLRI